MKVKLGDRFWITITTAIIVFTFVVVVRNLVTVVKTYHRINLLEREKEIYEKRIAEDSTLLENLQYDEYLEQYAREHYHMQRRNEDVYIIPE
ncbi:MAG: septum formation initiator [Rikenellaceae bacterium]|nr:septum formation initiator [Rikenellaceae bacterium]MBQ3260259.1 septum formation initiator family protein [Alistipes sp.]MBQ7342807.1 septum formation initiator family protein [Alistipes sp.]